jgi:hypothetical protein
VAPTHSGYQSSYVQSVSDPPAGPRVFCGCARGLRLPIHLTVCFEAGRSTLTQSSWTASARRCSRKWMSGHAAKALVLLSDRGQPKTRNLCSLGEPTPPGQRESPFPLDHYLSWMTTNLTNLLEGVVRPSRSPGWSANVTDPGTKLYPCPATARQRTAIDGKAGKGWYCRTLPFEGAQQMSDCFHASNESQTGGLL